MRKQVKLVLLVAMIAALVIMTAVFASAADVSDGNGFTTALAGTDTEINLTGNITLSAGVVINRNVTINGNGNTITFSAGTTMTQVAANGSHVVNAYAFNFAGGTVALNDVTVVADNTAASQKVAVFYTSGAADVTLNNVITNGGYMTIVMDSVADMVVDGANSFLGQNSGHQYVFSTTTNAKGGSFELKNGKMSHTTNGALRSSGDFGKGNAENFTLTISGGTWAAAGDAVWLVGTGSIINITGGTVSSTAGNTVTPNIEGGTINISGGHVIATGNKYAVNVRNSSTYTISGNARISGTICGEAGVLDLTGGTFDTPSYAHNRGKFILFLNGATTFNVSGGNFSLATGEGNGILGLNDSTAKVNISGGTFNITGADNTASVMLLRNGAVTITGGTFSSEGTGHLIMDNSDVSSGAIIIEDTEGISLSHSGTGSLIYLIGKKPLTIKNLTCTYEGNAKLLYVGGATTLTMEECTLSAKGSAIEFADVAVTATITGGSLTSTTGMAITAYASNNVTCLGGCKLNEVTTSANVTVVSDPIIQVDGQGYANFDDAMNAIKADGSSVVTILLADTPFVFDVDKTYTLSATTGISLGALTISGGNVTVNNATIAGAVTINANVTISGGSITGAVNISGGTVSISDCVINGKPTITGGDVTFDNVTQSVTEGDGMNLQNGADLIVNGGNFTAAGDGIYATASFSGTVTITGATIKAGKPINYAKTCTGTLVINSGTFTANGTVSCINIQSGMATIYNGTFNSESVLGQALIQVNQSNADVTIEGGTFESGEAPAVLMHDSGSSIVIKGGIFTATSNSKGLIFKNNGALTITGGTFTQNGTAPVFYGGADRASGVATISGGTFNALGGGAVIENYATYEYAISNLTVSATGPVLKIEKCGVFNVTDCDFTSTGSHAVTFAANAGSATFTNCTLTAEAYNVVAVYANGNEITLTNCTINENMPSYYFSVGTNMYETIGEALAAGATEIMLVEGGEITLDAEGTYTLDCTGIEVTKIIITAGNVTLNNLADGCPVSITNAALVDSIVNGPVTIEGGSISGGSVTGQITITGGTVSISNVEVYGKFELANADVIMTGVTATVTSGDSLAITSGNLTITDSNFTGVGDGIYARETFTGKVTLNNTNVASKRPLGTAVCSGEYEINGGTFTINTTRTDNNAGSFVLCKFVVDGATFNVAEGITSNFLLRINNTADVVIKSGTFNFDGVVGISGIYLSDGTAKLTIEGGTFTASGTMPMIQKRNGHLAITGGTFNSTGTGAILDIYANAADAANRDVAITGGKFISAAAPFTMSTAGLEGTFSIKNALIVDKSAEGATVASGMTISDSIVLLASAKEVGGNSGATLSADSAKALFGGATYYLWMQATGSASNQPVLGDADVRVNVDAAESGIRFNSTVPAAVVESLAGKTVVYGTIIAPADYVAAAGAFTLEALQAYAKGNDAAVYANVVAEHSKVENADGSVSFNAALINIKESNYERQFAAVSYVLVDGVYYYGNYDSESAKSVKEIVTEVWNAGLNMSTVEGATTTMPVVIEGATYYYTSAWTEEQATAFYNMAKKAGAIA